jgi:hypothetical protein
LTFFSLYIDYLFSLHWLSFLFALTTFEP